MPLSKIVANSITDNTITTDQIAGTSVHGRRNLIINGAMQVAQRATSATGIGGTSDTYKVLDRFRYGLNGGDATAGRFTASQAAITDLPGFGFAHKLDCTTADTSIAAGEAFSIQQRIEGQNLQQLAKGTSSAKAVTVSFYAKGTAKKYMLEIQDAENSRIIQQQFDVTTSWQRFSITFPGDTSGTIANNNSTGLYLNMWLHGGSTYSSGTYNASTWKAQSNADRAVGIGSFFSSTDNELFITGVQMELGEQATPFEHVPFGDELLQCQRYYAIKENNTGSSQYFGYVLQAYNSNGYYGILSDFPITMRAVPTVSQSGTFGAYTASSGAHNTTATIANFFGTNTSWGTGGWFGDSTLTPGHAGVFFALNNAKFIADAEL